MSRSARRFITPVVLVVAVACVSLAGFWAIGAAAGGDEGPSGRPFGPEPLLAAVMAAALFAAAGVVLFLDRRRREAEREKKRYWEALETAADGCLGLDGAGRIVFLNARAERLFGYRPGELLGRPASDILPEDTVGVADAEGPARELIGKRRDGGELALVAQAGPPRPAFAGRHTSLFFRDVTRTKQTRELLSAREAHVRQVVEQMPALLWTTDRHLRITSTRGAGLAGLNLQAEEVIGLSMFESLNREEDAPTPTTAHLKALRGESLSYEMPWKGRTFQVRVDPLRNSERQIIGTVGILVDVTDHKQAAANVLAALQERRQAEDARDRLVAILEATPDVVAIVGRDERLSYVNGAGRKLLGLGPGDDVSGHSLASFYPERLRRSTLADATTSAITRGVWSGETILSTHAGKELPVSQVILAHRSPDGVVQFLSLIAHDVSERLRLEEQLRQAQKMEAVGKLAGGVAHDFNNLLCVLGGYSEFLLDGLPSGDPLRGFAEEIRKAADRAAGLTRQLLAFSRKQMLVPRTLNLNALVTESEKLLRRLIGEDVELVTNLDPGLDPIRADPGQLDQVILNLAVNARDAMPRGGRLTLSTSNVVLRAESLEGQPEVTPGPYVMLAVRDTGCGMTPEVRSHLFEPFFTTKQQGKGTGLGLATVYGIVKQSSGHIEVETEVDRGTTFRIYLPRPERIAASPSRSGLPTNVPGGTETILIAEDEEGVRSLARRVLQSKGYHVLEACDGEKALAICRDHAGPIDLLLTDAVMPKLSGGALAQQARPLRPRMKVLFMSGFTESAMVRHGVATGEVECLLKPFAPDALAEMVRKVLDENTSAEWEEAWSGHSRKPKDGDGQPSQRRKPQAVTSVACYRGTVAAGADLAESLLDLSPDGASVIVRASLAVGEEVELILGTRGCADPVKVGGRVVWAQPMGGGRLRIGVRFRRSVNPAELVLT